MVAKRFFRSCHPNHAMIGSLRTATSRHVVFSSQAIAALTGMEDIKKRMEVKKHEKNTVFPRLHGRSVAALPFCGAFCMILYDSVVRARAFVSASQAIRQKTSQMFQGKYLMIFDTLCDTDIICDWNMCELMWISHHRVWWLVFSFARPVCRRPGPSLQPRAWCGPWGCQSCDLIRFDDIISIIWSKMINHFVYYITSRHVTSRHITSHHIIACIWSFSNSWNVLRWESLDFS